MDRRLELHAVLLLMMPVDDENVYFQPPKNTAMKYPCIRYKQNDEDVLHADNLPYRRVKRWEITIMDEDPDSEIPEMIASLPMTSWNRAFVADNINHTVYNMFF